MSLPVNVAYGRVIGRFLIAQGDGADADQYPDGVPAAGTITFTPSPALVKNVTAGPPVTVFQQPIECSIDPETGDLLDPQGQVGVYLVATDNESLNPQGWTYRVKIKLFEVATPVTFDIEVPSNGEVDLSVAAPVPASNGVFYLVGPKGDKGDKGDQGIPGTASDADIAAAIDTPSSQSSTSITQLIVNKLNDAGSSIRAALTRTAAKPVGQGELMVNVMDFGAKGDGVTDDTAAIQAALDATPEHGTTYFPYGYYVISAPLAFSSKRTMLGGGKPIIDQLTPGQPVLVSKNWRDDFGPTGHAIIKNFTLAAQSNSGPNAHGIVLRDYYSHVENVSITRGGGDGIHLTHLSNAGTSVSGSLVENVFQNLIIRGMAGRGLYLGPLDNAKITDGHLSNVYVSGGGGTNYILIGAAAGWQVRNVHAYGTCSGDGIHLANTFHTVMSDIYIEPGFGADAIWVDRHQRTCNISNVTVGLPARSGVSLVRFSKSSFSPGSGMVLSNLTATQSNDLPATWVSTSASVLIEVNGTSASGDFRHRMHRTSGSWVRYNGACAGSWSGGSAVTMDFPVEDPALGSSKSVNVAIHGARFNTQNQVVAASGRVHISSHATNGGWQTYFNPTITSTGFTSGPTFSRPSPNILRVTFTPNTTEVYGGVVTVD